MVPQDVVGGEIAAVEGEEEITEPSVWRRGEGVEDRVEEKFAEVVDVFGSEGCDGQVVGAGLAFGGTELGDIDAGEVEEGGAVVEGEVVLCLEFTILVRGR